MGILDSIGGFFSDKPATTTQTSTGTSTANPWAQSLQASPTLLRAMPVSIQA